MLRYQLKLLNIKILNGTISIKGLFNIKINLTRNTIQSNMVSTYCFFFMCSWLFQQSGLYRIHLSSSLSHSRSHFGTPLVDGAVVPLRILGHLVRETSLNMAKRRRLEQERYDNLLSQQINGLKFQNMYSAFSVTRFRTCGES